jgi:ribosomal protein L16/L10AE
MNIKISNNNFYNLQKLSFRHNKRRKKQRKRHAQTFFSSRLKKFVFYYLKFSSSTILKRKNFSYSTNKLQPALKYKMGLKSLFSRFVTIYPLRATIKLSKRYLRNVDVEDFVKYKMSVFPDSWLTAKPKAVRMGKGKGSPRRKIYFLKKGEILYELRFLFKYSTYLKNKKKLKFLINLHMRFLLLRLQHKFSIKNKIFKKQL